ncbi:MAG: MarR family transcriptional regulator [Gaiellales bacterium]
MRRHEAHAPQKSGDPRLSLLLLLVSAHQRMGQLVDRELIEEGVDSADYALLSLIGMRGPVRLTEVAHELGVPLTTASDAARRLEARGQAARRPNPADGRSTLIELTDDGAQAWRAGWPALQRIDARLGELLDDEPAVRGALEHLRSAFDHALEKTSPKT